MFPRPTIEAFDRYLADVGLSFDAIVIGGSALCLLGVTDRPTRDFDVLAPLLSAEVSSGARSFARAQRELNVDLGDDWLNNGPMQLTEVLPSDWRIRVQPLFKGSALVLDTLGRPDLLKTKLFALCDRGTDLSDCLALEPTADELTEATPWLVVQDANPDWTSHVTATLTDLRRRLGHGV